MECNKKSCPTTGTNLCKHEINFRTDTSLADRFSSMQQSTNPSSNTGYKMAIEEKIQQNIAVHLGNDHYESEIKKAIKLVMKRDWNFRETGKIGQIMVPKCFLSKYPEVLDFEKFIEKVKEIKKKPIKSAQETKMVKKLNHIKGERAEKKVFKALGRIFDRLQEDVLIIHGLKFMALTGQKGMYECMYFAFSISTID